MGLEKVRNVVLVCAILPVTEIKVSRVRLRMISLLITRLLGLVGERRRWQVLSDHAACLILIASRAFGRYSGR